MAERTRREMDAIDIAEFLDSQHTGVLSMADGDDAYSIPVSFDYDADESAFYFRFGYGADSQKRHYLDTVDTASFVVYDRTENGWQSVVAQGKPERVSESGLDSSVVEAVDELDIPYFQVHHRPAGEMDFSIVRLDATKLTGVGEGV